MEYASRGVANAGLATGIVGATGTALNLLGGNLGGLFGNNCNCSENMTVSRYELSQEQKIAELQTQVALRDANTYVDGKILEMYKYVDGRLNGVEAQICQQNVYNATNTAALNCINGQIAQLMGLTKLVVPATNICPQPTTTTGA